MALTANATLDPRSPRTYGEWVVLSGTTIYRGAMVGLVVGTGTVTNYNDASNQLFVGYSIENTSVVGDGTLKIRVSTFGEILNSVAITGTSAATNNGREVYATDENTFTLTRPAADAGAIGVVAFWRTGTTCDLLLFSAQDAAVLQLAGGSKRSLFIGSLSTSAMEGVVATDLVTNISMWGHGLITNFYAIADGFDASYAAGTQTVNVEIASTDLTGGVLTLDATGIDSQADKALIKSATAITAANEFNDGDQISVELATGGTGFTANVSAYVSYDLFLEIEYRAGN